MQPLLQPVLKVSSFERSMKNEGNPDDELTTEMAD